MKLYDIIILATALSMDAFAVSVCKGLSVCKVKFRHMLICGIYFGFFQALMPTIGYFVGEGLGCYISTVSDFVAFALLALIGISMIRESFDTDNDESSDFGFKAMIILAIATSIDALAAGFTFSIKNASILLAAPIIGIITFTFSFIGVRIGNIFGCRYKSISERVGGIVLILMGIKILLEHFGII
ncbi:MAG: manganese efflux pump [Ruminococcaceae bacterium]|nr:manganese efflux pump [Oscillospiraceae bacterium]